MDMSECNRITKLIYILFYLIHVFYKKKKKQKNLCNKKINNFIQTQSEDLGFDNKKFKKITSLNNYTIKESNKYFEFYLV